MDEHLGHRIESGLQWVAIAVFVGLLFVGCSQKDDRTPIDRQKEACLSSGGTPVIDDGGFWGEAKLKECHHG